MSQVLSYKGIAALCLTFLTVLMYTLLQQNFIIMAVPFVLGVCLFSFFKPKYLLFAIVALTPFSINLEELGHGRIAFYLPTEPLLFGLMLLLVIGQFYTRIFPREVTRHPISIALYFYLGWMFVTSLTSTDVIVSLKFLVSRLWFIIPLYFGGATLFLRQKNAQSFLLLYLIPFLAVVVYTLLRHSSLGFEEDPAHSVMEPFYRDHTQYGAVVAFFIPIAFGFMIQDNRPVQWRFFNFLAFSLLMFALVYTYARAAWLSVFMAFALWFLVKIRVRLWMVLTGSLMFIAVLFVSYESILVSLQKNKTDSSENLVENVESITNITTDASNLERINRWNSVIEMTRDRPLFGFGPGTYIFEYAPYQQSKDLTIISTNFGDVGNAHSEYLGPMAETGIPGFFTVLGLVFVLFYTAYRAYHRLEEGRIRQMLLFVILALVTYFIHGMLNNYLDSDKASVPVFGCIAIIAAADIISKRRLSTKSN